MRRHSLLNMESDDEIIDDFGELGGDSSKKTPGKSIVRPIHSDHWSIVEAFDTINDNLPKSMLGNDLMIRCAEAFSYLSNQLGFNTVQCVVIAMLAENGKPMSFRQMGRTLGVSRLSMMTHFSDMEDLVNKRWLMHRGAREEDGLYDGYGLARGVVSAIRENHPFVPENLKCENTQEFVDKVARRLYVDMRDEDFIFSDEKIWIRDIVETNKNLPICKVALGLNDLNSMSLLMMVIADYCNYAGTPSEGIGAQELHLIYSHNTSPDLLLAAKRMQKGTHQLFLENLVEHKCEDGMADINTYVATSHLKNEILAGFSPNDHSDKSVPKMNGFKSHKDITPKELFYNKAEETQVSRLQNLLSKEQLPHVQERLKKKGMRTGVCILMHGAPGTGKTATAYELARQTGRDIIQVQVTDFKDKYVGESENKLKQIFNNYRMCCQNCETTPILLLNEGDAILSKRTTHIEQSVDQMSNALQNILLEEMENLEGIMIVTTNLTDNLDKAFERRFIFKLQFNKPGKDVKAKIWKSMIDELSEDDSMQLAEMFDVSGGEIENIARKTTMEYVLTGKDPDLNMVKDFAKEEKLQASTQPVVGFNVRQ